MRREVTGGGRCCGKGAPPRLGLRALAGCCRFGILVGEERVSLQAPRALLVLFGRPFLQIFVVVRFSGTIEGH